MFKFHMKQFSMCARIKPRIIIYFYLKGRIPKYLCFELGIIIAVKDEVTKKQLCNFHTFLKILFERQKYIFFASFEK